MPWNGPIGGTDYSNCDFTKPPWTNGIMELNHEEVMIVIEALPPIEAEFGTNTNVVVGTYNQLTGYEQSINGDTYDCIKTYNPEVNTLGINEFGIIQPEEEEPPTDPEPEEPQEEEGE